MLRYSNLIFERFDLSVVTPLSKLEFVTLKFVISKLPSIVAIKFFPADSLDLKILKLCTTSKQIKCVAFDFYVRFGILNIALAHGEKCDVYIKSIRC